MKQSRYLKQIVPLLISLAVILGLSFAVRRIGEQTPKPFDQLLVETLPEIPNLVGWPEPFTQALDVAHGKLAQEERQREGLIDLAKLYHANGFSSQARSCYLGLESFEPENPLWPYLMGALLEDYRDKRVVTEYFARSLSLDPTYSLAYLKLGQAYLEAGQLDKARQSFEYRLQGSPQDPWVMASLGELSYFQEDYEESLEWLLKAKAIDPEIDLLYELLPEVYQNLGDVPGARHARLEGKGRRLGSRLHDTRLEFQEDYCYDPARLIRFARERRLEGELEKALDLLQKAVAIDPENMEAGSELDFIVKELRGR